MKRRLGSVFGSALLSCRARQMGARTHNQPSHTTDKFSLHEGPALSTDKIDCERLDALAHDGTRPDLSQSSRTYSRLLKLAGFMSLFLFLQWFWHASFLHSCFHGWQSRAVLALDDLCPQVEALVPPKYESLLSSLDDEFGSSEFKLKAYESLGGAVRIP